jgi:hypothetical protein
MIFENEDYRTTFYGNADFSTSGENFLTVTPAKLLFFMGKTSLYFQWSPPTSKGGCVMA